MNPHRRRQIKKPIVQTNYAELTVKKLKDLLRARGLRIPYNATKAQLTSELEQNDMTKEDFVMHKEAIMANHTKDDEPKPAAKSKGGEKRLFQKGSDPADKVELTKEEAEEAGFYWRDEAKLGKP